MPLLAERQEENYIFRTQSLQIGTFVEGTSALIFLWPHSLLPPPSAVLLSPKSELSIGQRHLVFPLMEL